MTELKLGVYEHYKGNLYEVTSLATHSETLEKMVVYKSLKDGELWVRPLKMFTEIIEKDGKVMPRFKFVK